jgi:hypothetical protein
VPMPHFRHLPRQPTVVRGNRQILFFFCEQATDRFNRYILTCHRRKLRRHWPRRPRGRPCPGACLCSVGRRRRGGPARRRRRRARCRRARGAARRSPAAPRGCGGGCGSRGRATTTLLCLRTTLCLPTVTDQQIEEGKPT